MRIPRLRHSDSPVASLGFPGCVTYRRYQRQQRKA